MPDPALVDLRILQGTNWSKPFRLLLDDGSLLDSTGYTARFKIRATQEATTVELAGDTTDGRVEVGFDPAKWEDTTAYGVGQQVVPTTLNGFVFECTVAGTSHATTEPTWPTTIGNTVTDGTVTWRCELADSIVTDLRIVLVPGDTDALENWGNGFWDCELVDGFGHVMRVLEGRAVLSREMTR